MSQADYDKPQQLTAKQLQSKEYYKTHHAEILVQRKEYRKTHHAERLAQAKEYYKTHRAERKEYYKTHRAEMLAQNKEYRKTHHAEIKEYRQTHRAKRLAQSKEYYKTHHAESKEYYKTHRAEMLAQEKECYKMHRAERLVHAKEHRNAHRLAVLQHYSNGKIECAVCGFSDKRALQIDHINNDGNMDRRLHGSGLQFYRWLLFNNYPAGYQVLCANCNAIKAAKYLARKRVKSEVRSNND